MSEFSTHMLLRTANNASPQPTENMRGLRSGLTNNAFGKWSMALLLPSSFHSLEGVAMQQISATRGSHPCSLRNGTNPTASRSPVCDASSSSPCCVLRFNAYAGPALLVATHLDRPSPSQPLWWQSQTCHLKYFDSHELCKFLLPYHSSPLPPPLSPIALCIYIMPFFQCVRVCVRACLCACVCVYVRVRVSACV